MHREDSLPSRCLNLINFQGSLGDADGNPINGSVAVTFRIYDVPVGGIPLLEESHNVTVQDGQFSVLLGSATLGGLDPTVFTNPELHLETEVDGEVLEPRQRIASVPVAMVAGRAETAGSADTAGYAIDADNLDGFDSSEFARAAAVDGVQGAVDAEAAARQAADAQLQAAIGTGVAPQTLGYPFFVQVDVLWSWMGWLRAFWSRRGAAPSLGW